MSSVVNPKTSRSKRFSGRVLLTCVVAATLVPAPAMAADEVGMSVRIKNQVTGSLGQRSLAPRDPVFSSERISARSNSHGEIRLNDNSKVLVGENSSISLDDFVTGSNGFAKGSIKVAKGAFRFITGNSPKGAFKVETPVSTIGVRGTVFDVYVRNGITRVVLFRGEVEVCAANNCIIKNRPCDIVEVRGGTAREADYLRFGDRQEERELFSLAERQARFRTGWRAPVFSCEVRAALDPGKPRIPRERSPDGDWGLPTPIPDTGMTIEPDCVAVRGIYKDPCA